MNILSHRGYWKNESEKNTKTAFLRSFEHGFGTETDVRDLGDKLIISHDPATGDEISLRDFLSLCPDGVTLALNVKADGLARKINEELLFFPKIDWFVFDMSIPDMRDHLERKNPVFVRRSDVESDMPWIEKCDGIWLDSFEGLWFDRAIIDQLLKLGKKLGIVSPELHKRDHLPLWNMLKTISGYKEENRLFLCTDLPEAARMFLE